ncbi:SIP domain-containing protein [Paracoccus sp. MBLB3053]|uniref:SIP domain-containing protein n=1 Tax=Paracoccus aurantius TaxID=3073814 RepID=A0ABU2HXV0_9RHOB|nr:SIP domain-containing protein [Paracoccus sp. MBLB3053]MDS9469887.1 SIP domain-containing protein [Paracoccus sp. MBLB3053]
MKHKARGGHRRGRGPFDYGELRLFLLALIAEAPSHGYELIRAIEARSAGRYIPSPGVVYPNLAALEDMGHIQTEPSAGRKSFAITTEGQAFLAANRASVQAMLTRDWAKAEEGRDPIRAGMHEIKSALTEVLRHDPGEERISSIAALLQSTAQTIRSQSIPDPASRQDSRRGGRTTGMDQIITRHRFDTRRRVLSVQEKTWVTPNMIRFVLHSEELADFQSLGPDDHIKLFFETGAEKPEMRDYTPRAFDRESRTLTLDFAIHEAGPATQWAVDAEIGAKLSIGGPRGSTVIAPVFDWWLLIGDETALPAMGRWVEEMPEGMQVVTFGLVTDPAEEQVWQSRASHQAKWLHRADPADPAPVLAGVGEFALPEGRGFIWIAAEAGVARALRDHFEHRGHPREGLKAAGYWLKGEADASVKSLD